MDPEQYVISAPSVMEPPLKAADYKRQVYNNCLQHLTLQLNFLHGENYPVSYWETIVGPWLLYFVSYAHDCRQRPQAEPAAPGAPLPGGQGPLERQGRVGPEVLIRSHDARVLTAVKDGLIVPFDFSSFILLFDSGNYGAQVASLVNGQGLEGPLPCRVVQSKLSEPPLRQLAIGAVLRFLAWISRYRAKIGLYAPGLTTAEIVKVWFESRGLIAPLHLETKWPAVKEARRFFREGRDWQLAGHRGDPFESVLWKILPYQIPFAYLEGYQALKKNQGAQSKNLKAVFSSLGWFEAETFKVFAALWRQKQGVKLVGHQHGGLYGIGESDNVALESRLVDAFLTWGWDGNGSTRPFFGLKISRTVKEFQSFRPRRSQASRILYVTTTGSKHAPNNFGFPTGGEWERYIDWEIRFLKLLNQLTPETIVVRVNPWDRLYGLNQKERLKRASLNIHFSRSNSFVEDLAHARLVVCDNNFTTLLESYACDIPTVLFLDPDIWPLHDRAQKIFEDMAEAGLYHSNPETAARHIGSITANPGTWWNSSSVRPVVEKFRAMFAQTDPSYARRLAKFLQAEFV